MGALVLLQTKGMEQPGLRHDGPGNLRHYDLVYQNEGAHEREFRREAYGACWKGMVRAPQPAKEGGADNCRCMRKRPGLR